MWPLINYLCLFTGLLSMFLDNVTTVLLMTPIIIRICEVSELNPTPVLIIVIMSCNIAGTATPMGDPPNIMIISNEYLIEHVYTILIRNNFKTIQIISIYVGYNLFSNDCSYDSWCNLHLLRRILASSFASVSKHGCVLFERASRNS